MEEARQQQQHGARHTADGEEHVRNVVAAAAAVEVKQHVIEMNNDNVAEEARAGSNQAEAMAAVARALSKQAEAVAAAARALSDQVAEEARARSKQEKEARARTKQAEDEAVEKEKANSIAAFLLLVFIIGFLLWLWLS